jgi:hypothetical protein
MIQPLLGRMEVENMSQAGNRFDPNGLSPEQFTPGTTAKTGNSDLSSKEIEEIIREVRERRLKNPNPKRYSTQEVLAHAERLAKLQEDA